MMNSNRGLQLSSSSLSYNLDNIYLFKVNNRTIETLEKKCEICSKLTTKTPERRH